MPGRAARGAQNSVWGDGGVHGRGIVLLSLWTGNDARKGEAICHSKIHLILLDVNYISPVTTITPPHGIGGRWGAEPPNAISPQSGLQAPNAGEVERTGADTRAFVVASHGLAGRA